MQKSKGLRGVALRRILVATDFSETAALALDRAMEIARTHSCDIVLVHVMQPELPPLAAPEMMVVPPNLDEVLREAAAQGLEDAAARVRDAGISVSAQVEIGRAASCLVEVAEGQDADVIVMGTRGNTGFKGLLLGSVAEEVVRTSRRPVLTIHPGDDRPIEPVRNLLLPTDFSPASEAALELATRVVVGSPGARILLVHTFNLPASVTPLRGFGKSALRLVENAEQMAREATEPAATALREQGIDVDVVVERADAAEIVIELASSYDVDLVVMGTRGLSKLRQGLLGSTAERVVQHATCPVLTVQQRGEDPDVSDEPV